MSNSEDPTRGVWVRAIYVRAREIWPGLSLAGLVAGTATFVSENYGGPQLLYALFFGLAFHFLFLDARCRPGIEFAAKTLLRIGVALLGARITVEQIAMIGIAPLVLATFGVVSTIALGAVAARRLGLARDFGLLSGGAVAICGASAALAIASVMPKNETTERQTLLTVVGVTGLSTLAMIVYPLIAKALFLSDTAAGIFLGGTIHDVAQVVGAGLVISRDAGDTATIVKLFRVTLLLPAVLVLALIWRRSALAAHGNARRRPALLPGFLVGFAVLVAINSAGVIPQAGVSTLATLSRTCLVVAIAALGLKTAFDDLAKLGWRPVALMLLESMWLALMFSVGLLWARH